MIGKLLGHIFMILGVILGSKILKSLFPPCKKTRRFQLTFFNILGCFLMVFGVNFRTLGSSNMSIWCRRNTDFLIFGLPNSCSKNESPQSSKIMRFLLNFGAIFGVLLVKNATRNQVKKRVGEKLKKSGPQRP